MQCEFPVEKTEAQKVQFATQCPKMTLLTGFVEKKQLNGTLCLVEKPTNSSHQSWGVLCVGEDAVVSIATTNLVRLLQSELGNAVTRLMAQMGHRAVQRFFAIMDKSDVANLGSETEHGAEQQSKESSGPPCSKRRKT